MGMTKQVSSQPTAAGLTTLAAVCGVSVLGAMLSRLRAYRLKLKAYAVHSAAASLRKERYLFPTSLQLSPLFLASIPVAVKFFNLNFQTTETCWFYIFGVCGLALLYAFVAVGLYIFRGYKESISCLKQKYGKQ